MSNAKYLAFDTPNTKKPLSSGVLNAIIFGINEQYNLKFETSQIVELILFFYSGGTCFLFFLLFLSFSFSPFFPISHFCFEPPTISLLSLSLSVSASLSNETQAGASSQANLYCSGFFFGRFCSGCVGYGFGIFDCRCVGCGSRVWVID